jgi:putative hydrolase of the HAD superfamily
MKYEVIIFDADETLFDFKKSEREAFKSSMLELGLEYDENYHLKIYHEINSAIWKELEEGKITQKELKVERFVRLSQRLDIDINAEEMSNRYVYHLSQSSFLLDGSVDILEQLYKNYRLLIITNGITKVQDSRIRKSLIGKYFENIIISEEAGVSKPDPAIFQYALNKINYHNKDKILMIGDSLSSDIKGGINYGIDTCWFNPYKIKNESDFTPTYEIESLNELLHVL